MQRRRRQIPLYFSRDLKRAIAKKYPLKGDSVMGRDNCYKIKHKVVKADPNFNLC